MDVISNLQVSVVGSCSWCKELRGNVAQFFKELIREAPVFHLQDAVPCQGDHVVGGLLCVCSGRRSQHVEVPGDGCVVRGGEEEAKISLCRGSIGSF